MTLSSRLAATVLGVGFASLLAATVVGLNTGQSLGTAIVEKSLAAQRSAGSAQVVAQLEYYESLAERDAAEHETGSAAAQ